MEPDLGTIVSMFSAALKEADDACPGLIDLQRGRESNWVRCRPLTGESSHRSELGKPCRVVDPLSYSKCGAIRSNWGEGISPHEERCVVERVVHSLRRNPATSWLGDLIECEKPYRSLLRSKKGSCDIVIEKQGDILWLIEVKAIRLLNGKCGIENTPPGEDCHAGRYDGSDPEAKFDRLVTLNDSALSDVSKLNDPALPGRKAVLVVGYDYKVRDLWMEPEIRRFEVSAAERARLGERQSASFGPLRHHHHTHGTVYAWEIEPLSA
jgi:hypothetical protein